MQEDDKDIFRKMSRCTPCQVLDAKVDRLVMLFLMNKGSACLVVL